MKSTVTFVVCGIFCITCTADAFHAADECRRQVKSVTKFVKNVEIVEFQDHIWSHHEKCIQKSTNMIGVGVLIREIDVTNSVT